MDRPDGGSLHRLLIASARILHLDSSLSSVISSNQEQAHS